MSDRSTAVQSVLLSAAGVIVVLLIIVCVNLIVSRVNARWDTTREKLYSLSEGTRVILADIERDVTIKLFYSRSLANTPVAIRTHAGRVEDFLSEYVHFSRGRVRIERYDPKMDTVEESWAQTFGIQRLPMPTGEPLYFGMVVLAGGQDEVIPFLDPARERQLEYDLTRLIARIQAPRKPRIGVISSFSVFGDSTTPFVMPGQPAPDPPWFFINELRKSYDVAAIRPDADRIAADLDLLLVVHPREVSEPLLYAMDQFLLGGGNLLIFVDPFAISDPVAGRGSAGTMQRFFNAWGLEMADNMVLMDLNFSTRMRGANQQAEQNPVLLSMTPAAINAEHVLTAQLENLLLPVAGSFSVVADKGLEVEPLLRSSEQSAMIPSFRVPAGVAALRQAFEPSREFHDLALQLTGKFESGFVQGPPVGDGQRHPGTAGLETDGSQRDDNPHLSKGLRRATVILVADADMLFDGYYIAPQNVMGVEVARMFNDNLNLLLNACEMLTGSEALIGIRSREGFEKPFTRVRELELDAQARWLEREQALVHRMEQTNEQLNQLEQRKDPSQQLVLSPEQEAEVRRFREERARITQELTAVRRNLRADIDALAQKLKFINIFMMPMAVSVAGIGYALYRRRRRLRSR
ncbi:MAG: Gldg family protein [Desulfatitalea sp.]|nr:Gldg family protein [Desulfatitalea sp.]